MLVKLFGNARFYVLILSVFAASSIFLLVRNIEPQGQQQVVKLTQYYAFSAIIFLYFALLIGPVTKVLAAIPVRLKSQLIHVRRPLGVSAFFFAILHASFAFFGQLGGLSGLFFLSEKYLFAISLSFTALVILSLMAATSFDFMIQKLGYGRWKALHRFVYLAAILIVTHALLLGTHFADISALIPQICLIALVVLLFFEALAIDLYVKNRYKILPKFGFGFVVFLIISVVAIFYQLSSGSNSNGGGGFGIHSQHILLAQQAQNPTSTLSTSLQNVPGLTGDRTKRFTVSFNHSDQIAANLDTNLSFQIFDAASGNQIQIFDVVYEKTMHLVIVDEGLDYYNHIHPTQDSKEFSITTQFPHDGVYHLYTDFQPKGAIEQQIGFTLRVGSSNQELRSNHTPDINLTKMFGDYEVTLTKPDNLNATDLAVGKQPLKFTFRDAKTKEPLTNLKPYLAAFGHLVMINSDTLDYIHVHPTNIKPPRADATGGPDVEFLPLGLYGPIKPGIYRVFGQFNPNGNLMVADFTVEVK